MTSNIYRILLIFQATHEDREDLNCADCGRGFRYPSQLRDHMMCHSGTRPHICPECGMDFMKVCILPIFDNCFRVKNKALKCCVSDT